MKLHTGTIALILGLSLSSAVWAAASVKPTETDKKARGKPAAAQSIVERPAPLIPVKKK